MAKQRKLTEAMTEGLLSLVPAEHKPLDREQRSHRAWGTGEQGVRVNAKVIGKSLVLRGLADKVKQVPGERAYTPALPGEYWGGDIELTRDGWLTIDELVAKRAEAAAKAEHERMVYDADNLVWIVQRKVVVTETVAVGAASAVAARRAVMGLQVSYTYGRCDGHVDRSKDGEPLRVLGGPCHTEVGAVSAPVLAEAIGETVKASQVLGQKWDNGAEDRMIEGAQQVLNF